MPCRILLTSFQPWLQHHTSNTSDDLLHQLQQVDLDFAECLFLRRLPVQRAIATQQTLTAIDTYGPNVVVCCGMAEKRDRLTLERQAFCEGQREQTSIDLETLTQQLQFTDISDDAGKFVCEGLYFQVLRHLREKHRRTVSLFLHVPLITQQNKPLIFQDVHQTLRWLAQAHSS